MFKSGDRVAEHLELVRLLGAGGMGSVWVAEHLRLRTRVAVKFLSASMLNNAAARSRFDREAQLVAQVKSPHVVQVLDQGVTTAHPPQPFIVMELLEGEDLSRLLERRGTLPLAEAVVILDQVCAGLGAAHAVGLIHRDIKPDNIFIMSGVRPFVKILDFGVARTVQQDADAKRLTSTGGVIGTAHFMSPEQLFEGKNVDLRTDIWALGVVLYRMLTGRLPFDGSTYGDLCLAVNQGVYAPPSQSVAVHSEIDGFIARALAKDRRQRFSSVKEFADELNALAQRQSGLPVVQVAAGTGSVAAVTGPEAAPPLEAAATRRTPSGTERMVTGPGAAMTVASSPQRSRGAWLFAVVGLCALLLAAAGLAALDFWPRDPTDVAPLAPPAAAAHSSEPGMDTASAASSDPETTEKGREPTVEGSNQETDVKASASATLSIRPKVSPARERAPAPKPATARTSSKPKSHATVTTTEQKAKPPPPQEKYRGF